jgi:hypothetical protein
MKSINAEYINYLLTHSTIESVSLHDMIFDKLDTSLVLRSNKNKASVRLHKCFVKELIYVENIYLDKCIVENSRYVEQNKIK